MRVSAEELSGIIAELEAERARALAAGEAHGNYGETFEALALDLRDCRAARSQETIDG